MRVLVTGAAGFIGFHVATALAALGHEITGLDNLTPYYPVRLKHERLAALPKNVRFVEQDVADAAGLANLFREVRPEAVVHLAAQAGVRYSIDNPLAYIHSNDLGHVSMLEAVRRQAPEAHLVYASSSSIYGARNKAPFHEDDRADTPSSLYAATKRANELASSAYAHLYGLRQIGLRFFTVYGIWGRPDMAYWSFSDAILNGREIALFDQGRGLRDFTHVDDVVRSIVAMVERPVFAAGASSHRIYNIGNSSPVPVTDLVDIIERSAGVKAKIRLVAEQPGDVPLTSADTSRVMADYGFAPSTPLEDGVSRFVAWFRDRPDLHGLTPQTTIV
ncbi:NAD-dependent epimerase/dehydratase family protein [Methylopila turkensis]|uniref:NAD-dependent epimerase n=1 Tax=Methylopila turkensis TaxID=1437816 RepID=A0A9W6JPI3_9HYPH|nr:NAD-dependent epimerase/dehydratase family protein [Methylopila turkensis]GLK81390.1 NAD-dependent epimerase [Methylopila turkensis]